MSMLLLSGQVLNVLLTPEGESKEGKKYGGYHQVQLMCEETLRNGEKRMDLFTLSCESPEIFKELQGKDVRVPVGVFARGGNLNFYMVKGENPEQV